MTTNIMAATTMTADVLASGKLSTTASTAIYTVPASTGAKIGSFALANITGSAVTVSVAVVPSGLTDDGTHTIVHSYSLAANDTLPVTWLAFMGAGDFIAVTAGTANAVDFLVTGVYWS